MKKLYRVILVSATFASAAASEAYPYGIVQECRWQVRLGNFDRGRVVARFRSGKQPSK